MTATTFTPQSRGEPLEDPEKTTFVTVIKDQQALIKGNPGRVLANRWQAAGRHRKRKFPQRRKLVPLFRRISQNPFDGSCIIIDTYEEILAA